MRLWILPLVFALGCGKSEPPPSPPSLVNNCEANCDGAELELSVESLFHTEKFPGCLFASPIAYDGRDGVEVLVVGGDKLAALDPATGEELWSVAMPLDPNTTALTVATPALVGDLLVLEYHVVQIGGTAREQHYAVVVNLAERALDPEFERLSIDGSFSDNGLTIPFRQQNALGRGALVHAPSDGELGRVYVTYGNARDIQPWHGFAFELDLDAWRASGPDAAIVGSLITTPETECGPAGQSGSRSRVCGGGLWSPSGPLLVPRGDSHELILAPGNGQLDITRNDFANTLMRVGPGLQFEHGCDMDLCSDFDPDAPSPECTASCTNLFVLNDHVGDPFPEVKGGRCEGLTMFQCWERLDYVGGSTPVHLTLPSQTRVLAYPTKDGAVYLVDADHLGTLYDRAQLTEICGTDDDQCRWDWAGMIVTQPTVLNTSAVPTILVPTFMPDNTHAAGVVALEIVEDSGTPKFRRTWTVPADSAAATERFREHPTRIALQEVAGHEIAWIVEALRTGPARLLALDTATGRVLVDQDTGGSSMRFTQPLIVDDTIFVNHCVRDGEGSLEGLRIVAE